MVPLRLPAIIYASFKSLIATKVAVAAMKFQLQCLGEKGTESERERGVVV